MGVSHLEVNLNPLLANLASTLSMTNLTYVSDDIVQHFVPLAVSSSDNDEPRYMSGFSALSPFSLNTTMIPSIVFIGSAAITRMSSTYHNAISYYLLPSGLNAGLIQTSGSAFEGTYDKSFRTPDSLALKDTLDESKP